jgi:hypothetical protein
VCYLGGQPPNQKLLVGCMRASQKVEENYGFSPPKGLGAVDSEKKPRCRGELDFSCALYFSLIRAGCLLSVLTGDGYPAGQAARMRLAMAQASLPHLAAVSVGGFSSSVMGCASQCAALAADSSARVAGRSTSARGLGVCIESATWAA